MTTLADRCLRTGSLLAAMAVAAGCTRNPATNRSQFLLTSIEQEITMGAAAAPGVTAQYGGEVPSTQLRSYVREVGARLAAGAEAEYDSIEWSFTILDDDIVNAFALPGGYIYVSRGLLERFDNEAQVAGVLGHEIGHVTARHIGERMTQHLLAQGVLSGLAHATESELALWGADMFANGFLLTFSREQEAEADGQGVKYMVRAGYDPVGMIEVLEVLQAAAAGPRPPEFLSTHPYPETRLRMIRKLIDGPYSETRGNPAYERGVETFRRRAAPYLGVDVAASVVGPHWCGLCSRHEGSAS